MRNEENISRNNWLIRVVIRKWLLPCSLSLQKFSNSNIIPDNASKFLKNIYCVSALMYSFMLVELLFSKNTFLIVLYGGMI